MVGIFARRALVAGMVVLAGGCAIQSQVAFDPAQNRHIRTVALVNIPTPPAPTIRNHASPAVLLGGGLAAGVAAASSAAGNQDPFGKLLASQRFDFSKEMEQAITERLRRMGYRVVRVEFARENPYGLLKDYDKVPTAGADAILDATNGVFFGYSNVNLTDSKYRPHLHVYMRLVDAKTKDVLYGDEMIFGYTNPFMSAAKLPAPDKYFYGEIEEVLADPHRTVEGLRAGIRDIAEHMALRLSGAAPEPKR
jgi:hypothetical protein